MTYMAILWIITGIIMVIVELSTLQFISVWFAGGALLAFISSFFVPFQWQCTVFVISSAVLILCTMPLVKKLKNQKHIPTNFDIDIGKDVTIIETINRKNDTGRAVLNGVNWLAVCENEAEIIEKGETATIKDIKGATLIVAKK